MIQKVVRRIKRGKKINQKKRRHLPVDRDQVRKAEADVKAEVVLKVKKKKIGKRKKVEVELKAEIDPRREIENNMYYKF